MRGCYNGRVVFLDKKFRLKDKFNFSKVKILKICAYTLCLIASIALLAGFNFQPFAAAVNSRKIPIYCVDRSDNKVAITFDAAWGADKTQKILDVCHRYGVKATFFLVGFWIDNYPDMVKKIDEMGHTIGTNSETHPKMGSLSAEKITQELSSSMKKITDLTGKEVKLFRAPFGDYSNRLLEVAEGMGLSTIQWDVDSLDWKGISAVELANRVQKAKSGSIILCHNNSEHIVEALPIIFEALKAKGLEFVTVDSLIYYKDFYIDHAGKQILNAPVS